MLQTKEEINSWYGKEAQCDLCHKELDSEDIEYFNDNGSEHWRNWYRFSIALEKGDPFDGSWDLEQHEKQICQKCYESKILPLFRPQKIHDRINRMIAELERLKNETNNPQLFREHFFFDRIQRHFETIQISLKEKGLGDL